MITHKNFNMIQDTSLYLFIKAALIYIKYIINVSCTYLQ